MAWMSMASSGIKVKLPFGDEALDGVNQSVLGYRVEETDGV